MMATTEMDCGSSESRSEQGSLDPDSKYPLKVLYCGGKINAFAKAFPGFI